MHIFGTLIASYQLLWQVYCSTYYQESGKNEIQ